MKQGEENPNMGSIILKKILKGINELSDRSKAKIYSGFFKTSKGEYGEGDFFLGLTVPSQRIIAKKHIDCSLSDVKELLHSKYHEHRLTGFLILVYKFETADDSEKKKIVKFYLENKDRSNNWDLVDSSADKILGKWLIDKDKSILYSLAKSDSLWDRRISIISTFEFIINKKFTDTIKISKILLKDKHDLIQKAVGWMLREMGKRDEKELIKFLDVHYREIPRTMLRYSIERLSEGKKKKYMAK